MADKYYLGFENDRNVRNHDVFEKIIHIAFGASESVMVGHHFVLMAGEDIRTINEIPSADTLIFDHVAMKRVFGEQAINVMVACVRKPAEERDAELRRWLQSIPDPVAPHIPESDAAVAGDYPEAGGY